MKAFFSRSTRNSSSDSGLSKYSLPPFPHPLPERRLTLHLTNDGLTILPSSTHSSHHSSTHSQDLKDNRLASATINGANKKPAVSGNGPSTAARVKWGRETSVQPISKQELNQAMEAQEADCELVCYGVVGIVTLFKYSYLLVITSRDHVGDFLHQSQPIYRCTGVLIIPLDLEQARTSIKAELNRQRSVSTAKDSSSDESSSEEDDDVVTPSIISRNSFLGSDAASSRNFSTPNPSTFGSATLKPSKNGPWLASKKRAVRSTSEGGDGSSLDEEELAAEDASNPATQDVDLPSAAGAAAGLKETEKVEEQSKVPDQEAETMTAEQRWHDATRDELEDKVVKETARQYSRGEMWFSYDYDITTPLQRKQESFDANARRGSSASTATTSSVSSATSTTSNESSKQQKNRLPFDEPWKTLPLWRRADRRFWHNEHLSKPFVDAGLHAFVLPMMQGYFQITTLPIEQPKLASGLLDTPGEAMSEVSSAANGTESDSEEEDRIEAQLLIVSRRSKERAGLRYQRRGINEQGQVANFVETEQILMVKRLGQTNLLSFIQFRGSIPMYWGQSPFSLKPPPVLERNDNENRKACQKHFEKQTEVYGKVICINLAEQHGKEGQITQAYKQRVEDLKNDKVQYVAFDFHKECAGMKFENVSKLLENEKETLSEMNCFWRSNNSSKGSEIMSKQNGAFRVSCLDCLDRTNVVQSAFARQVLLTQLERLGITPPILSTSPAAINGTGHKDEKFEFVFNDSWANNGDMVSQIYAGTRALKGDFTRTGKRNFMGMMNDATASVHRMVQGAVTDFFRQTTMDYHYGLTSLAALERYNHDLNMKDPTERHRLARVRAEAVESCADMVVNEGEEKLAGWTLFSPIEANQIQSSKLEEKVVLLTTKALYVCGFDFTAEKLSEFSRILLGDVVGLKKGVYIISPNEGYDPEEHWGFVLSYIEEERRLNTASLRNIPPPSANGVGATNFMAFRAVRDDFAGTLNLPSSTPSTESKDERARKGILGGARLPSRSPNGRSPKEVESKKKGVGFSSSSTASSAGLSSHEIVDLIVAQVAQQSLNAGACDEEDFETFVKDETIQSLAQAKSNAPLFAPLIEGLKRRLWL